jgi:FixJ family two-component response regulator
MTAADVGETLVFVIDDDAAVRTALTRLLRSADLPAKAFESCEAFLADAAASGPSCLVLDVELPGLDGFALTRQLATRALPPPIVFLTGHGDIPMSVRAMKGGAVDFLTKPASDEALLGAVQTALDRDRVARRAAVETREVERLVATLTPREREVMGHVIAGKQNKRIAADLGTTEKTVKVHRGRMMAKMGVQSVAELVRHVAVIGIEPTI